jgi:hypothetical protein
VAEFTKAASSGTAGLDGLGLRFVTPAATIKRNKYFPRHFRMLSDHFHPLDWRESGEIADGGNWVAVVRSPGYRALGRSTAEQSGVDCCFDLLDDTELRLLKQAGGNLLVDLGWEMLNPTSEVVISLSETLRALEIEPARVFLFHSNQNARTEFNAQWLRHVGTQPPYSLEYPVAMALCVAYQQDRRDDRSIAERRANAHAATSHGRRCRFLVSFNGEVRPHRLYMAAVLEQFGLLDRCDFSLVYPRKSAKETEEQFRERSLRILSKLPRGGEFAASASNILARLPLELDIGAMPPGGVEDLAWESQDPAYYHGAHFTLVVDTSVSGSETLFVTEKVLKPIMNHSPFLLVGSAGGADLLRSYGFQTFEPHFRQCGGDTLEAVLNGAVEEVHRLAGLAPAQLSRLDRDLQAACDHNALHFWNAFPAILRSKFEQTLMTLGTSGSSVSNPG